MTDTRCPALCRAPASFLARFGSLQDIADRDASGSRATSDEPRGPSPVLSSGHVHRAVSIAARARRMDMTARLLCLSAAAIAAIFGADMASAQDATTNLSPQALQEIAQVEAKIDRIETETLERLAKAPDNQVQQVELLGKLILYDKQLSVYRNEACMSSHMPETAFPGPVAELNRTPSAYPGWCGPGFSAQKPQTHAYAPLSPVLH